MPSTSMLRNRGLYTFSNYFTSVPEGAMLRADNTVIDRDGIVEPRRGISDYSTVGIDPGQKVNQLSLYKNRILTYLDSQLWFDNGSGVFTAFTTDGNTAFTFEPQGIYRAKSIEAQGNYYFTTADGIKKISLVSSSDLVTTPGSIPIVTPAGSFRAPDIQLSLDLTSPGGFLPPGNTVSYRVVWGTKDANDNLILGHPSLNAQITNTSTAVSYGVRVTAEAPPQLVGQPYATSYFYQLYRSVVSPTAPASDELNLVYEAPYDGSSTDVVIFDNTPESIRNSGTPLYTNEFSGQGITQANDSPPIAQDITLYKNFAIYANTKSKQTLDMTLQGLDGFAVFDGTASNPNRITSITFSGGTSTFHMAGSGHLMPTGSSQSVVIFYQNSTPAAIVTATFNTSTTFTVPGNYSAVSPTIMSVFASYINLSHGSGPTVDRFYFVGRSTETDILFNTNKAGMTDGSGFLIDSANDDKRYLFWWQKTSTSSYAGVIPPGVIDVPIDISDAGITTAAQVIDATITVMESTGDFYAFNNSPTMTVVTSNSGYVTVAPAWGVIPAVGWTVVQVLDGIGQDIPKKFIGLSTSASVGIGIESTARSLIKVINESQSDVILFYTSSTTTLPGNISVFGTQFSTPVFKFTSNLEKFTDNSFSTGFMFNPVIGESSSTTSATSASEIHLNRFYYSKQYEPESVPALNFIDVGPKDKAILRVIALRNTLFFLKEDAIYSLTGTDPTNFYLTLFDSSTLLVAPDTAQVLNNQIYMLSSQGVATVTETGVGIISRPVEDIFTRIKNSNFTYYNTASFGCSYESDRAYLLFTVFNVDDQFATKAYRYNTFTQAWTTWIWPGNAAIVNPVTNIDKLYIGSSTTNLVEVERKNLSRTDYADKSFDIEIAENSVVDNTMHISSVANVSIGDMIVQTQYLTISQFNRLLAKMDMDGGLTASEFAVNYAASASNDIARDLFNLTTYMNTLDPIFTISSNTPDFATAQTEFNTLITELNDPSSSTFFKDYPLSTGTVNEEILISGFSFFNNSITSNVISPIISGPAILYQGIPVNIVYAPIAFGDPSLLKHVREATILFEFATLAQATIGYATDLSPGFETVSFGMEGDGSWGNNTWDQFTWGGQGSSVPFRTLIPRQKQRCRFIKCEFLHRAAYYKFSILGISYVFEATSTRAYK